ncbi:MAG: radical SAM protein [Candidatus Omnitrophota bacterium]
MSKAKVLLVYVNSMMDNLIPLNISYLTACLKEEDFDVELFDTTFYRTSSKSSDEARVETLQVKPFDLSEYGINYKGSDVFDDFKKQVERYNPDLIGFSVVEPTYIFAEKLLDSIKGIKANAKVVFGGVFSIFAYKKIIKHPLVDMVCHGEGEKTIVNVAKRVADKQSCRDLENLIVKEDEEIFENPKSSLVDLNELPYLDFSLFEKERFYKPMGGKVLRMVPVEFARGCPYICTYCASPALAGAFKECGSWYREKSVERIIGEIEFYWKKYEVEYFYFISESFLNMKKESFDEFVERYKSIKVPFWFNTRIETITSEKLEKLRTINCNRISIGLESGSEYVRKNLLKRFYSNEYFVEKFKVLENCGIAISVNNIIGFPDETRQQIFDTIELNRQTRADSFGAYIFQPFQGTYLRDYCVKKGYLPEDYLSGDSHLDSRPGISAISEEEVSGLQKTFALYVTLPKTYYDEIKIAEKPDPAGLKKFNELSELYYREYA